MLHLFIFSSPKSSGSTDRCYHRSTGAPLFICSRHTSDSVAHRNFSVKADGDQLEGNKNIKQLAYKCLQKWDKAADAHERFTFIPFLTHFAVFTDTPVAGIKLVLVSGSANYF